MPLLRKLLLVIFVCSVVFTALVVVRHAGIADHGVSKPLRVSPPKSERGLIERTHSSANMIDTETALGFLPAPVTAPPRVQTGLPTPRPTAAPSVTAELHVAASTVPSALRSRRRSLGEGCARYASADPYMILDHSVHLVPPPEGNITIVCCQTTKGEISVAVHPSWAPLGAQRFLEMVTSGFFSSRVGLFRSMKNFLVQFGLAGDPEVQRRYHKVKLMDDPSWLPFGPPHRTHRIEVPRQEDKSARATEVVWSLAEARQLAVPTPDWTFRNVSRYQRGYMGYAGAGKNSRGTQLILAYQPNVALGGGSPWEVPFGQLIGAHSYRTIDQWTTKYGEQPSQGKIMNRGVSYLEEEFPDLDYITSCEVLKEHVEWLRRLKPDQY
jgi:peptidyl-prolyl cis-trans isomerase A (cyclophilin A)